VRIDLHIHTTASDGSLSPAAIVHAARAGRLDIIAITDHDTAAGVAGAQGAALKHGDTTAATDHDGNTSPIVISGIEISSTHAGAELHFLGYFIDHTHPLLHEFAHAAGERRQQRMAGMIERLAAIGLEVEYDEVVEAAGRDVVTLGRPHLARALVERGYVQTTSEAFDRFLGDGGPAFLPTELLTPREAIELIQQVGGIPVWAHPPWEVLERELQSFVDWGLQGLECYRPRNTGIGTRRLLDAADAFDLLVTGGSDWHGEWHGPLGGFSLSRDQARDFLRAGGL
jgi:predicted metal-dependent phosphoesterase TrpH